MFDVFLHVFAFVYLSSLANFISLSLSLSASLSLSLSPVVFRKSHFSHHSIHPSRF